MAITANTLIKVAIVARGFDAFVLATLEADPGDYETRKAILEPIYARALRKTCQTYDLDSVVTQDDYVDLHVDIVDAALDALEASSESKAFYVERNSHVVRKRTCEAMMKFLPELEKAQEARAHAMEQRKKEEEAMATQTMTGGDIEHDDQSKVPSAAAASNNGLASTLNTDDPITSTMNTDDPIVSAMDTDPNYHDGFLAGYMSTYHEVNKILARAEAFQDHLNKKRFHYPSGTADNAGSTQYLATGTKLSKGPKAPGQEKLPTHEERVVRSAVKTLKEHATDNRDALATYRERIETKRAQLKSVDPAYRAVAPGVLENEKVAAVVDDKTDFDTMEKGALVQLVIKQSEALQCGWQKEYEKLVGLIHKAEPAVFNKTVFKKWEDLD